MPSHRYISMASSLQVATTTTKKQKKMRKTVRIKVELCKQQSRLGRSVGRKKTCEAIKNEFTARVKERTTQVGV